MAHTTIKYWIYLWRWETYVYIRPYNFNNTKLQLLRVGINATKAPNIRCFSGFNKYNKGAITGYSAGYYISCTIENIQNYSKASRNCTSKIIHDGWKIKSDYLW